MDKDLITLTVPAFAAYARSVRMMASNLAVVCGMNMDDVEDVRMAAGEGLVYACTTLDGDCEVRFSISEGEIAMDFSIGETDPVDAADLAYADLLLTAVCDEFTIDEDASILHLLKRAADE